VEFTDPLPLIMEVSYAMERFWRRRFKTLRQTQDWSEIIVEKITH
jgi:hypothetical protein